MKIEINFEDYAVEIILKRKGYTIETVDGYLTRPVYHNDVEYETIPVRIAYKKNKPENRDYHTLKSKHGIEVVASEVISDSLFALVNKFLDEN